MRRPHDARLPRFMKVAVTLFITSIFGAGLAHAQATPADSEKEIERYRAMISDPFSNPEIGRAHV